MPDANIPRILHYCWLGDKPEPTALRTRRDAWQRVLGADWELRPFHNAHLGLLPDNGYTRSCQSTGEWAFLSDYVRAWVLHEHGGVYVDVDVEIRRSFTPLLRDRAFSGFERPSYPFTAVWGTEPGHPWPAACLEYLDNLPTSAATHETNTIWTSRLLGERFGIAPDVDTWQLGDEGIVIYPSDVLCVPSPASFAVHEFDGSWVREDRESYSAALSRRYETRQLADLERSAAAALFSLALWRRGRRPLSRVKAAGQAAIVARRTAELLIRGSAMRSDAR